MRVNAAACESPGGDLTVEEVVLDEQCPYDVPVRATATGICHTDYHYLAGDLQACMPLMPGHEGADTVEAAGAAVTSVALGDLVCFWRRGAVTTCSVSSAVRHHVRRPPFMPAQASCPTQTCICTCRPIAVRTSTSCAAAGASRSRAPRTDRGSR